jgi:predicted N-acyltransferase
VETVSAHWVADPRFARAVEQFLEREGAGVARYVDELCEHSPFKD